MAPTAAAVLMTTSYFNAANFAILYSFFLKAFLFITGDGELRVGSGCSSNRTFGRPVEELSRVCAVHDGLTLCMYASSTHGHLLAMERATGRLTSVPMPQTQPGFSEDDATHCLWFQEQSVKRSKTNNRKLSVKITGCPQTRPRLVQIEGPRIRNKVTKQICTAWLTTPFTQRQNSTIAIARQSLFKPTEFPFNRAKADRICHNIRRLQADCPEVRNSYPLLWNGCGVTV